MKKRKVICILFIVNMLFSTMNIFANGNQEAKNTGNSSSMENKTSGFVVGFSNGYWGNTWRAQLVENFENRAKEYKEQGILSDYMISNTNNDATEQLNQINAMINKGVDAILIDAVSPTTIRSAVLKAQSKGILVIIANDPAAYEGTIGVFGNNYSWQKIQTVWLAEQLQGKGNIVKITGVPGNAADTLRQKADKDVLANYPNIKVLSSAPGSWSETEAQSIMTTMLSSYDNIDAILTQDVMGEGILKAFENSGKKPPIMTGDYVKSFFNEWNDRKDLISIAVPYAPGISVTCLDVAIKLLQGGKIRPEVLVPNPMDENLVNSIMIDPPYVVTREGDQNAVWMDGLVGTKAITLTQAMDILKDKPESAALDGYLDIEAVNKFFE